MGGLRIIHPPREWMDRYVALALPIVKRTLEAERKGADHDDDAGQGTARSKRTA